MSNEICNKKYCTGCGACVAVCPKQCITFQPNPQGHLFPHIDKQACVNCNLCRKTCPVNTPVPMNQPLACYAAWAKDEKDRTSSSSGAASSVFAAHILKQGGVVYGAALQDNTIQHIRVSSAEDLPRIKGSKYVYSYVADVYKQVKQDLKDGKTVLFTGTPCQNAAVYNLIGENPNLILVNLICHGVPSMQMLRDHLKAQNIIKIHKIQFRHNNHVDAFVCNDYKALDRVFPDAYVICFLEGYTYRSSCYNCSYAQPKRTGDITIGDFWGLGKEAPFEGDATKGCSAVIINTAKGQALFSTCQDKLQLFERKYQEAINGNGQLSHPVPYTWHSKLFNKLYPLLSFEKAAFLSTTLVMVKQVIIRSLKNYAPNLYKSVLLKFCSILKELK